MLYSAGYTPLQIVASGRRGLEIPLQVTETMEYSTQNNEVMDEPMATDKTVAANVSSVVQLQIITITVTSLFLGSKVMNCTVCGL